MELTFSNDIIPIHTWGNTCNNDSVCPTASTSDCNQTEGYNKQSAKWSTVVQVTMGGGISEIK